ncbi:DHHC-type zinc finger-containing protein [Dictyostelium discoideum AX4]|uniref:Putative ZDHHC-type palmitoyltransferase 8 n=1 Tax=Dictyostelium discoideum TaxID=44689 RepID=ZDHC8_DICDI|nr:DHHC-type zinc finger-containing protein [Dictyostelium discoideum AX4]Q54VH7.1 RecName: Full=Putative ZDHHC-type palmitoyltransferase 8; AltName: Full=Zinc finger DHHC domain-containing protein 8 [Dictyostelium discoideum]EAL67391.1 DHHC-type zinc finger-containing protein [Dictyostelium discoideum AX4]|eukprot:XP_641378.1 DHHC-type zinc finger-containing protein [Dictyostelium discoideum AX4]
MIDLFDFVVLSSFIILLPLVTDFLNNTFPNAKIGRLAQEVVGMILVFFIVSLIFAGVSLWYTHFLPFYYTKSLLISFDTLNLLDLLKFINTDNNNNSGSSIFNKITFYFHIFFTIQLVVNLYYYYYQTITADNFLPKISKNKQIQLFASETTTTTTTTTDNINEKKNKLCGLCDQVSDGKWSTINKPKSHHCRICKRCIDSMDHHCPFAANCIGINNHHYFILFIGYTVMALIYACYLSFFPYYHCIVNYKNYVSLSFTNDNDNDNNNNNNFKQLAQSCAKFNKYSFIFLCCCLIVTASFGILLFQTYLIITNSKTVQLLSRLKKSKSFLDWFKWLYQNFKQNASINNIYSLFPNFKFYNLIIPYYKRKINKLNK